MKIQDKLKQMGEYACLALCYLEMVNIIDDRNHIHDENMHFNGLIDINDIYLNGNERRIFG